MKLVPKIMRFQEGGQAPEAPQSGGGQDPIAQIAQMAVQALQNQDCNAAMQVCNAFVQMLQQSQQGGGGEPASQGAAPQEGGGEPVYRRGGKLLRRMH